VVDGDELAVERSEGAPFSFADLDRPGGDVVFLELGLDEGEGQLGTDQGDVLPFLQQVRNCTDVVLVAVRQHDSVDQLKAVPDPGEVRQDHVHTWLVLFREQDPAVNYEEPTGVFENRHVAADLTQPAQRHDAQAAMRQLGQRVLAMMLRCAPAHRVTPRSGDVMVTFGARANVLVPRAVVLVREAMRFLKVNGQLSSMSGSGGVRQSCFSWDR
jgi:hypothetical protein